MDFSTKKSAGESSDDDGVDEHTWPFLDKDLCSELEECSKDVERFFSDINNDNKAKQLKQTKLDSFLVEKNQSGKGAKRDSLPKERDENSSKRRKISDDILAISGPSGVQHANTASDFHDDSGIIIHKKKSRFCKKYQGGQLIFEAMANPAGFAFSVWDELLINLIDTLRRLIEEILQRSTEGLSLQDLIRICVFAPGLDYPISTCLNTVEEMTVEKVLYEICKVLQSKKTLRLDEKLIFDIVTVRRPIGAGRKSILNIEVDRLRKKSVVAIPSDNENICCARAIVVGHAAITKNQQYNSIRNGSKPLQKTLALKLHEQSGVPIGPCGLDEIKKFEELLDVQIHVISAEHFNK
ncbi:hypothetical protein AVEN_50442-1, partial [Araneus ventricosus]